MTVNNIQGFIIFIFATLMTLNYHKIQQHYYILGLLNKFCLSRAPHILYNPAVNEI